MKLFRATECTTFSFIFIAVGCAGIFASCPEEWIPAYRSCLLIVLNETTYDEAEIQCLSRDANVVQLDQKIIQMLYAIVDYSEKTFWASTGFQCSIITPMNYSSANCSESHNFICEKRAEKVVPCSGSIYYESHCLVTYGRVKESREDAKHRCALTGSHLFSTHTKFRASLARVISISANASFWIGDTNQEDDECLMVTPLNAIDAQFTWHPGGCGSINTTASALCESPISTSTTTKAPRLTTPKTTATTTSTTTATKSTTTSTTTATLKSTTSSTTTKSTTSSTTTTPHSSTLRCPEGHNWVSRGEFCYWETSHETDKLSWEKARKFCLAYGGDLATYSNLEEENVALNVARGTYNDLWIGLKRDPGNKDFKWVDWTPVTYTNWAFGQPDNSSDLKLCAAHVGTDSTWMASYCNTRRWFVCKVRMVPNPTYNMPSTEKTPLCESGDGTWYLYGHYCFRVVSWTQYSWDMAKMFCQDNQAQLASIHSNEETEFFLDILQKSSYIYTDVVWIGLSARGLRAPFSWADGSSVDFIKWDEYLSQDNESISKCIAFSTTSGYWSIQHCNMMLPMICRKSINGSMTFTTPATPRALSGYCPDDWYTLGNKCYKNFGFKPSEKLPWGNARNQCASIGASLATIHSEKEQVLLTELVQDSGYSSWFGLYATLRGSLFHWVDNSSLDYTNWNEGEPSQYGREEDCVEMVYDEISMGKWNDVFCNSAKSYICEKLKDPSLKSPGKNPTVCTNPSGWSKLTNSCYKVFFGSDRNLSWLEAQAHCRRYDANLVSITDGGVNVFLKGLMPSERKNSYWIGVRELERNTYDTLDRYPLTYTNWLDGQPTRISKTDNCVVMNEQGLWKVRDCEEKNPFICQFSNDHSENGVEEDEGNCPDNTQWQNVKGPNCFLIVTSLKTTWRTAVHRCFQYGGHLASFHSHDELDSLSRFLTHADMPVYIGLGLLHDGSYGWIDGSPVDFVNWQVGEPSDENELCVEMHTDVMTWNDVSCYEIRGYICSTPKNFTRAKANKSKAVSQPYSQSNLDAGGIIGIVVCLLLVLVGIAVIMYYTCPLTRHLSRRLSDCDTPLQECSPPRFPEVE